MKNKFFDSFKSRIKLRISGKNANLFIKKLNQNKIELLNINNLKHNQVDIIIYKKDYEKLLELKSIYDVTKLNIYGIIKIRHVINLYKYVLSFIIFGILLVVFLSNIIFDVEIVNNDSTIRDFMLKELQYYDLKKYKFVKSYDEIQNIKNQILEKYNDKIEWLEITRVGTKYIVKLESRIIPDIQENSTKQNIVSKKSAVLKKIIAKNGTVVKEVDNYVSKGDVVISGNIYLNETLKDQIRADGTIYGEVWYKVSVEYPFVYIENKLTGNSKNVYVLKLLNKNIELTTNHFENKKYEEKVILSNNLIPISFVKQTQKEIINIEEILTYKEAIDKAIAISKEKINASLKSDEYIIDCKVLKQNIESDKVVVELFLSIYENITDYEEIVEIEGD
jgi:similar to stage IV sporulation protein